MNKYYFKGILTGLLAAAVFAVGNIWLGGWLVGAIGAGVVFAGMSALDNSRRAKTAFMMNDEVRRLSGSVKAGVRQLNEHTFRLQNNQLKTKVRSLAMTCDNIVNAVQKKPERAFKTQSFFDYYMPTVDRMLTKYEELERNRVRTEDGLDYMTNVFSTMDELDGAFKAHLQSIIDSDKLEAAQELKILGQVLREEND